MRDERELALKNPGLRLEHAMSRMREIDNERRAEVKDASMQGATHVGAIAANVLDEHEMTAAPATDQPKRPTPATLPPEPTSVIVDDGDHAQSELPSLYKLAIIWGFILALLVVLFLLVVWLLAG